MPKTEIKIGNEVGLFSTSELIGLGHLHEAFVGGIPTSATIERGIFLITWDEVVSASDFRNTWNVDKTVPEKKIWKVERFIKIKISEE